VPSGKCYGGTRTVYTNCARYSWGNLAEILVNGPSGGSVTRIFYRFNGTICGKTFEEAHRSNEACGVSGIAKSEGVLEF
jgi:hypothetical protein